MYFPCTRLFHEFRYISNWRFNLQFIQSNINTKAHKLSAFAEIVETVLITIE